jgi:5-formyltetrahydrofolate cyclo-ligase
MSLTKPALRNLMRARRADLSSDVRAEAARAVAAHFANEPGRAYLKVAGYQPLGAELDPGPLLTRLAGEGAMILLPVVMARGAPLCFREAGDPARHTPDAAGILAPPPDAAEATPDIVLAPLLAFDRCGGRLGQGGGYYDRTLAGLRASPGVLAVGLGFAVQEVDEVPRGPHDQILDAICTEIGYRRVRLKDPG